MEKIPKSELIEVAAVVRALVPAAEFEKSLPKFSKWLNENVSQKEIDTVLDGIVADAKKNELVHIKKDELTTLYAHTVAIIGAQEINHRLPGVRSLILNLMTDEEMKSIMILIKSIEDRIIENK